MDFLAFDNGVIKNPHYRKDVSDVDATNGAQRKWRRQPREALGSATLAYTRNLLRKDEAPFQCTPAAICFANYDVGAEQRIVVAFINTSTVPKTFRLMPILPRFANVLSFEYTVPPRISPGLSWSVTVKYCPRTLMDITTALYVKTDEGVFAVPLTSSQKAFTFSVEPEKVDFGTVIVGEKRAKRITLRNSGALPGTVLVGGDFKPLLEQKHTNPVDGKLVRFFRIAPQQHKIEIAPFSFSEILVHFTPFNPCVFDQVITFTEKGGAATVHTIPITGCSTDLPVFLTNSKLSFGACFYGEKYWDEVSLVNKANIAAVAEFQVPGELSDALVICPKQVCVQSGEEYSVRVVFTPAADLPKDFSLSIKCVVQDQTLPLTLTVEGVLSRRAPSLATSTFDVGAISLQTMHTVVVPVTNEASVIQLVGFESLPPWVTVAPEVLALAPCETANFTLKMEAPQEGRFSQRLKLVNEYGDMQPIFLSGQGTRPSVAISSRTLLLPPCNVGRSVSATIVISNTSFKPSQFSFRVPNASFTVSPSTGVLQPSESVVVAITFNAPLEYEIVETPQAAVPAQRQSKSKRDPTITVVAEVPAPQKRSMYEDWESCSEKGLWSRHKQFRLQCSINNAEDESTSLVVRCCAVRPPVCIEETVKKPSTPPARKQKGVEPEGRALASAKSSVLTDPDGAGAPDQVYNGEVRMDFGKLPIHHHAVQTCKVRNTGLVPCTVRAPPTNPFSSFSLMCVPFDGVPPNAEAEIPISFHPHVYGKFGEVMQLELLMRDGSAAFVYMHVQGVCSPTQLTISLADSGAQADPSSQATLRHVLFETTRKNESTRRSLNFHNVGSFPLDVVISSLSDAEEKKSTGSSTLRFDPADTAPFLVHPRVFVLQPNTKQIVDVVFAPSDAGVFLRRLNIAASGESSELAVEGRSVGGGVYSFIPIPDPRSGKPTAVCFEGEIGCRPDYPVSLAFAEDETKTIVIGNLLKTSAVEFEIQNWEQTRSLEVPPEWSVLPVSQSVASCKETRLTVQHSFPASDDTSSAGVVASSLFPFRFTVVLKGEGAAGLPSRVLYVVCTD